MQVISYLIEAHIFRYKENSDEIEFLLLKRADKEKYAGVWQMVTGSIDDGEKAFETALREITEETGFVPDKFWVVPHMNSFYSPELNSVCMVPVFAALVGYGETLISEEHNEFRWVDREEAKKLLAWQGQRESVDTIHEYFTKDKSFLKFVEIKL